MVSPAMPTDEPNSWAVGSAEAICCCSLQVVPDRTKTWAEPATVSNGAPTTTVSPERATEVPTLYPEPPEAMSRCSRIQVVPDRTNTYAEEWIGSCEESS